jgi:leader peptidase (prepilin peptidase) / N-methyltransferase
MNQVLYMLSNPALAYSLNILLALCFGSFITLLVARFSVQECESGTLFLSLCRPRSHCPSCLRSIKIRHLLPVISYLLLRGRCASCKTAFGMQYLAIELSALLLGLLVCMHSRMFDPALLAFVLICLALAIIDFKTQMLPDFLTLGGIWLGLILSAFGIGVPLVSAVIGAAVIYCLGVSVELIYKLVRKRDGLGRGDSKLLALFAVWLGLQGALHALLVGVLLALLVSLYLLLTKKMRYDQPISFGPFLVVGALAVLFNPF